MPNLRAVWGRRTDAMAFDLARLPPRAWLVAALLLTYASGSLTTETGSRVGPFGDGTIVGSMCVVTALTWLRYTVTKTRPLQRRAGHHHDRIICKIEDQAEVISDQAEQIAELATRLRQLEDRLPLPYPEPRLPSLPAPISE
jgi:hypothetical protein